MRLSKDVFLGNIY